MNRSARWRTSAVRFLVAVLLLVSISRPVPPSARAQVTAPAQAASGQPMPARTDVASYELTARWDPSDNQIQGVGTIIYQNPSNDTLGELWLKLYLNAFRDADTTWMQEAEGDPQASDFDPRYPGWIRLEALRLADTGEDILPADADTAETVLRVPLPAARAVEPGRRVRIAMRWTSQLPHLFARTGVAGDFVMAGQWYPKLAVYDRGQWDTEPWHANAEFFADFGDYTLALTTPSGYVTGASGVRQRSVANSDGTITTTYRAESVSDVAWTAWPGGLAGLTFFVQDAIQDIGAAKGVALSNAVSGDAP